MLDTLLKGLGRRVVRSPGWVLAGVLVLTAVAAASMAGLEIHTTRTALFPRDLDVSRRFGYFLENFGTAREVVVVLDGEPEDVREMSHVVAAELLSEPALVKSVLHRLDVDFFLRNGPLLAPLDALVEAWDRVETLRPVAATLAGTTSVPALVDALDHKTRSGLLMVENAETARDLVRVAGEAVDEAARWLAEGGRNRIETVPDPVEATLRSLPDRGYFQSHDGRLLFLFVQPASGGDDRRELEALIAHCRQAGERARRHWSEVLGEHRPAPIVALTGLPVITLEELETIERDVVLTVAVAAVAILLVVALGLRSLRAGVVVFAPLLVAGVWNLGLAHLLVGHLTLLTSAFTAILFGVGVDYGIFLFRRVQEERRAGLTLPAAVERAVCTTGRTVLAASATTAMAFAMIATMEFEGFAELGLVAATGILLVMATSLTVLPALILVVGLPPPRAKDAAADDQSRAPCSASDLRLALAVSGAAIGACLLSVWAATSLPTDFDLMRMMPRGSEAARYQRAMAERSDFQPEIVVATARDLAQARSLAEQLRALESVARVESLADLVPERQDEKLQILAALAEVASGPVLRERPLPAGPDAWITAGASLLEWIDDAQERAFSAGLGGLVSDLEALNAKVEAVVGELRAHPEKAAHLNQLQDAWFEMLRAWTDYVTSWTTLRPVEIGDVPPGLLQRLRGQDGAFALLVFPTGTVYDVDFLDRFLGEVYGLAPGASGFPTVLQVFSRMVMSGFFRASALAVLAVLVIVTLELKNLRWALLACAPLFIGTACMLGILRVTGRSLNYANVIAIPLVMGMAVDYGVYLAHRLRADAVHGSLGSLFRFSGPVMLAGLTTLAGVSALVIGRHQGVASLGEALVTGIVACLLAAVLVVPCMLFTARWTGITANERAASDRQARSARRAEPEAGRSAPGETP